MFCTGTFQESSKDMKNLSFPNPNNLHQHVQGSGNSSLLRFRSAPSSLIEHLVNDGGFSSESDSISMMSNDMYNSIGAIKSVLELDQNNGGYCDSSSLYGLQNHTDSFVSSVHVKAENGGSLNLMRQNSLQSGGFDNSAIESGSDGVKEAGSFNYCNDTNGSEANRSTSMFQNQINFSSGPSSNSTIMPHTAKIENESFGISSSEIGVLQNGNGDLDSYMPTFTIDSWGEEPAITGLKRTRDDNEKIFSGSQSWDDKGHTFGLTRHMSLPSSSTEMAAIAKYLHFQDSTPCKIRAKRGFATHPRSIAERVRRTRISDRMRKLQELFPDMDKQTNTADMLEMAVDYIKNLQKQVDELTDTKSNCTCSSNQQ